MSIIYKMQEIKDMCIRIVLFIILPVAVKILYIDE